MSSADSKDRESTREQSDDDIDDMAGEADRSEPSHSDGGGVRDEGISGYRLVVGCCASLSCISLSFRALRLSFSIRSLAFTSSNSAILASISSILTRFLSLAFCAATLFFSFLLISFSSGVR